MNADDVRRALVRIAHEIVEEAHGADSLVLVGIHSRGVPLARRIASQIEAFEAASVPIGAIDISLYRDDLSRRGLARGLHASDLPVSITDKRVVLVDDVLYT